MARAERTAPFPVPREALWGLLSDTERLNRELRLPSIDYAFLPRAEGGSHLRGAARHAGIVFRYDEEPYQWVRPARWSVRRVVDRGPLAELTVGVALEDVGESATRVTAFGEALPRGLGGRALTGRVAAACAGALLRACDAFAAHLTDARTSPYPRHAGVPPVHRARLDAAIARLDADPALTGRLAAHLADAPIEDTRDLRPFRLADQWGVSRNAVLALCLHAVRAGMLELRWRILCPACQAPGQSAASLEALTRGDAHCPSCDIRFGPAFDRHVEVCFSVAPTLRPHADADARYCIGGPGNAPHVALQALIPAGATRTLTDPLPAGSYRLASPQVRAPQPLELLVPGGAALVFDPEPAAFVHIRPADRWSVENRAPFPLLLRVEAARDASDIATAARVTALPAFRAAFGSEVLSPGAELAVRHVAFLFTDLKDSTRLYAERGDAPSYAAVRDHFTLLSAAVEAAEGGVLKTMGDAVLAVFCDPAHAVAAALAIQRDVAPKIAPLTVKVGVHAGPALAVNSGAGLDYFGHTVNVASRIQGLSDGGDIVLSADLAADPSVAPRLAGVPAEAFVAALKGTDEALALVRLRP